MMTVCLLCVEIAITHTSALPHYCNFRIKALRLSSINRRRLSSENPRGKTHKLPRPKVNIDMATLTLYPTVKNDICGHWHDADTGSPNCLNVLDKLVDGDCVHHHVHTAGNHDLTLDTFRDAGGAAPALAAGDVITDVIIWIQGVDPNDLNQDLTWNLVRDAGGLWAVSAISAGAPFTCANCLTNHSHCGAVLTVAEVNGELYNGLLRATYVEPHIATVNHECDLAWVDIVYTPAPTGMLLRNRVGAGL